MSTTTQGATIFYTVGDPDNPPATPTHSGNTPTGSTQVYTGPFASPNCADTLYNAIAYKSGYLDSNPSSYLSKHSSDFGCGGGGMMMSSSSSTVTVFSVWDGDWAILEEYDANGNRLQGYVQGYHGLVKTLVDSIYYYQDELGSTSHIASSSGALLESYRYNLYGAPTYWNVSGAQISASAYNVVDLGNGGARWMPELGLYDDRNRFMSPDIGRFLQPDPIGFKSDASNLYRYIGNDWVNKTDPLGLDTYTQDRDLMFFGGSAVPTTENPTCHRFAFTTDKNGNVVHTYSWGNTANERGWNPDQREDKKAAEKGLKHDWARKEGDSKLDPYIQKAFDELNKKENEHRNHFNDCRSEEAKLLDKARKMQEEDKKSNERQKENKADKQGQTKPDSRSPEPPKIEPKQQRYDGDWMGTPDLASDPFGNMEFKQR